MLEVVNLFVCVSLASYILKLVPDVLIEFLLYVRAENYLIILYCLLLAYLCSLLFYFPVNIFDYSWVYTSLSRRFIGLSYIGVR